MGIRCVSRFAISDGVRMVPVDGTHDGRMIYDIETGT